MSNRSRIADPMHSLHIEQAHFEAAIELLQLNRLRDNVGRTVAKATTEIPAECLRCITLGLGETSTDSEPEICWMSIIRCQGTKDMTATIRIQGVHISVEGTVKDYLYIISWSHNLHVHVHKPNNNHVA